jgi:hypothetical protein
VVQDDAGSGGGKCHRQLGAYATAHHWPLLVPLLLLGGNCWQGEEEGDAWVLQGVLPCLRLSWVGGPQGFRDATKGGLVRRAAKHLAAKLNLRGVAQAEDGRSV